jgi:hypothetical protein
MELDEVEDCGCRRRNMKHVQTLLSDQLGSSFQLSETSPGSWRTRQLATLTLRVNVPGDYRQGRKRRIDAHVFLAGNQHIAGETVVSNSTFIKSSCSQLSEPAQFVTRRFDHEMWWRRSALYLCGIKARSGASKRTVPYATPLIRATRCREPSCRQPRSRGLRSCPAIRSCQPWHLSVQDHAPELRKRQA